MRKSGTLRARAAAPSCKPLVAALLLGLGLNASGAHAAMTISVTASGDAGTGSSCTLRQAIVSMNTGSVAGTACMTGTISGSSDTITFDTGTFPNGGANAITLADSSAGTLKVSAADLTIDASANGNVTIQRSRPSTDSTNAFGILYDNATSGSLTLNHLTISNGNVIALAPNAYAHGGGISCLCANLSVNNSVVSGNAVNFSGPRGGVNRPLGYGGGLYVGGGNLTLTNSTISGNSANAAGGGIAVYAGNATLTGSTVSNNTTSNNYFNGRGAGIYLRPGNLTLTHSIVSNNTAQGNAGGMQVDGVLSMTRSTVSGNTAGHDGGGIKLYSQATLTESTVSGNTAQRGGGIYQQSGYHSTAQLLSLNNSTLSGNSTPSVNSGRGGGIYSYAGDLALDNSTVGGNSSGLYGGGIFVKQNSNPITLTHVTLAANTASSRGGGLMISTGGTAVVTVSGSLFTYAGTPATGGGNVAVTTGAIAIAGTGNLVFGGGLINAAFNTPESTGDPLLGPLQDNGGPTQTLLPGAGSAAIDAGGVAPCAAAADQRGVRRPQGSACDIGAVEVVTDRIFADNFDGTPVP